ncbi:tyrosine- kinase BAZ1B-like, partial [Paramuricea clavata]
EMINQVRDCRRLESLGSDRNHSRYWLFQSHPEALFVEKIASPDIKATECPDIGDVENENLKDGKIDPLSSKESWFYYNTKAEIDRLISSLNVQDENESALKQKLKGLKKQTKKLHFEKRQTDSSKACSEEDSIDHLGILKGEMSYLASRIIEGDIGCMENLETWSENVMSRSSFADLVTLALELATAVKIKSLWKKLGDREEWLKKDWVQAVKDSMTSSRLCFCIAMLDYCIMWDISTLFIKCKICRRSAGTMAVCDKCRKGFHIGCLRPALDDVPDEDWLCPVCIPVDEQRTRRAVTKKKPDIVDEESQEENDDYCDVCGGDGELICCDNCPKVYHKECHDPPLRNIPRGVWQCCSCQGRRPTAKKRSLPADREEYFDLECSYSESSSEESGFDVDDTAAVEWADRAKRREREKEEAKSERSKKKKKANKRKGKKRASLDNTEDRQKDIQNKKCRETIREYLNENTSENENSSPREKRTRLERNEENTRRSSRKRKCSSSEDECHVAKRKPRQNSELRMCEKLLKDLMHHEDSWPFTEPVDTSEVPDYLEVVACPMDFGTMKRKLNAFEYNSYEDCINDIKLVFANSDQYNLSTSDHGLAGISLGAYFKDILPNYFPKYELQELPQKSSSRELRKRRS